jgi:hypothetical protein
MGAPSRVVRIGGLMAICLLVGGSPGSAQTGAATPTTSATPTAATTTAATTTGATAATTPGDQAAPTPAHLTAADAAALKADPNCQPAAVACTWSQCYPLASKWSSYSSCIAGSCQVKEKACVMDLIQDLYDPERERSKGAR